MKLRQKKKSISLNMIPSYVLSAISAAKGWGNVTPSNERLEILLMSKQQSLLSKFFRRKLWNLK